MVFASWIHSEIDLKKIYLTVRVVGAA